MAGAPLLNGAAFPTLVGDADVALVRLFCKSRVLGEQDPVDGRAVPKEREITDLPRGDGTEPAAPQAGLDLDSLVGRDVDPGRQDAVLGDVDPMRIVRALRRDLLHGMEHALDVREDIPRKRMGRAVGQRQGDR